MMQDAKVHTITKGKVTVDSQVEISKGAMFLVASVPTVIGLWAVACFIGGIVASGGPVSMAVNYFKAVAGV